MPSRPAGGAGAGGRGGPPRYLHRAGDQLLPPQEITGGADRGGQEGSKSEHGHHIFLNFVVRHPFNWGQIYELGSFHLVIISGHPH